jgi:hypothetical protein
MHMRTQEELTDLFTDYFEDKLTPAQIDQLATDVWTSVENRRARMFAQPDGHASRAVSQTFRPQFAW